jgi:hypothetical protein
MRENKASIREYGQNPFIDNIRRNIILMGPSLPRRR